ncbi:MAG: hypothetical protein HY659_12170, partial [Rhizobiales bacterium]|nr:hypothetical protein [Hyphomicrobiales bacterium]
MSSPSNKPFNPFETYAPKRPRELPTPDEAAHEKSIAEYFSGPAVKSREEAASPLSGEGDRSIDNFRLPRSLDPYVFEEPVAPAPQRRFRPLHMGLAALAAIALAAPAIHYLWVEASPVGTRKTDNFGSRFDQAASKTDERYIPMPAEPPQPRVAAVSSAVGAPMPASAQAVPPAQQVAPVPSQPISAPPAPLPQRPQTVLLEQNRNLAPSPQSAPSAQPVPQMRSTPAASGAAIGMAAPNVAADQVSSGNRNVRKLDPEQIEILMKQGEGFVAVGDLITARTVFQRAAEA